MWVTKEFEHGMDALRGSESRTTWLNRAIIELTIRQLLQKPFPFSDAELDEAARIGREGGIDLGNRVADGIAIGNLIVPRWRSRLAEVFRRGTRLVDSQAGSPSSVIANESRLDSR